MYIVIQSLLTGRVPVYKQTVVDFITRGASGCDFGFAWIWISRFHTLDLGHLHLGENSLHSEKMEQGATQI